MLGFYLGRPGSPLADAPCRRQNPNASPLSGSWGYEEPALDRWTGQSPSTEFERTDTVEVDGYLNLIFTSALRAEKTEEVRFLGLRNAGLLHQTMEFQTVRGPFSGNQPANQPTNQLTGYGPWQPCADCGGSRSACLSQRSVAFPVATNPHGYCRNQNMAIQG